MDNLTHSLVGVTLNRIGFDRWTTHATAVMLLAVNLPDADILLGVGGPLAYLDVHRSYSHSWLCMPIVALGPWLLWWFLSRREAFQWKRAIGAYALALVGLTSHLLLDWLNVYGIRFLTPLRPTWYRLDWVNIFDIWIWAILLLGVLGPLLAKLVYSEIGAKSGPGRGGAWTVLVILGLYLGGRDLLHAQAIQAMRSRIYLGETPLQVAALPGPANPLRWTGVIETPTAWRVVPVDLTREFDPDAGRVFQKPEASVILQMARRDLNIRRFLAFAQMPLWTVVPASQPEGGTRVTVYDLRFGLPPENGFYAGVLLDAKGKIVERSSSMGGWHRVTQ